MTFGQIQGQCYFKGKGKTVPLQARSGPEGSRKLRFPDLVTTVQDGGKVVNFTHHSTIGRSLCQWKIPM